MIHDLDSSNSQVLNDGCKHYMKLILRIGISFKEFKYRKKCLTLKVDSDDKDRNNLCKIIY